MGLLPLGGVRRGPGTQAGFTCALTLVSPVCKVIPEVTAALLPQERFSSSNIPPFQIQKSS